MISRSRDPDPSSFYQFISQYPVNILTFFHILRCKDVYNSSFFSLPSTEGGYLIINHGNEVSLHKFHIQYSWDVYRRIWQISLLRYLCSVLFIFIYRERSKWILILLKLGNPIFNRVTIFLAYMSEANEEWSEHSERKTA